MGVMGIGFNDRTKERGEVIFGWLPRPPTPIFGYPQFWDEHPGASRSRLARHAATLESTVTLRTAYSGGG